MSPSLDLGGLPTDLIVEIMCHMLLPTLFRFARTAKWVRRLLDTCHRTIIPRACRMLPAELQPHAHLIAALSADGYQSLLPLAARIEQMEHVCLARMLRVIHATRPLRPSITNIRPGGGREPWRSGSWYGSSTFSPDARWKPSWVERYRVRRALWQLETHLATLHHKALIDMGGTFRSNTEMVAHRCGWFTCISSLKTKFADVTHLPVEILAGCGDGVTGGEFDSVYYTLFDFLGESPVSFSQKPPAERRNILACKLGDSDRLIGGHEDWRDDVAPQPNSKTDGGFNAYHLGQHETCVDLHNAGFYMCSVQFMGDDLPWGWYVRDEELRAFSCLGFAIWDTERLGHLGLVPLPTTSSQASAHAPLYTRPVKESEFRNTEDMLRVWWSMGMQELERLQRDSPELAKRILSPHMRRMPQRFSEPCSMRPSQQGPGSELRARWAEQSGEAVLARAAQRHICSARSIYVVGPRGGCLFSSALQERVKHLKDKTLWTVHFSTKPWEPKLDLLVAAIEEYAKEIRDHP